MDHNQVAIGLYGYNNVFMSWQPFYKIPDTKMESRLIELLLEKGRSKASRIAQKLGRTLGPVLQVSEVLPFHIIPFKESEGKGDWTLYPPLSLIPPPSLNALNAYFPVLVKMSLRIRYSLE